MPEQRLSSAPALPAEWSAQELAKFLVRAGTFLHAFGSAEKPRSRLRLLAVARRDLWPLQFDRSSAPRSIIRTALTSLMRDRPALLSGALSQLLRLTVSHCALSELLDIVAELQFHGGEEFAFALIEWCRSVEGAGTDELLESAVYIASFAGGGRSVMAFLERLRMTGMSSLLPVEAAVRSVASIAPSLLGDAVRYFAGEIRSTEAETESVAAVMADVVERAGRETTVVALLSLDPRENQLLFNAVFSTIPGERLYTLERLLRGGGVSSVMVAGDPPIDASEIVSARIGTPQEWEWRKSIRDVLGKHIPSRVAPLQSEIGNLMISGFTQVTSVSADLIRSMWDKPKRTKHVGSENG
jgi:hypothetical protein